MQAFLTWLIRTIVNLVARVEYAYRLGQVSLDRESPEFFDNNAHLYVIRGDYTFRDHWEFLLARRGDASFPEAS